MLMFGRVSSLQIYYSTAILLGMFLQLINVLILIFDQSQNFVGKTKQLTSSTFSLTSSLYSLLVCCHPALLDHHPSLWKQLIAHFDLHRLVFGINFMTHFARHIHIRCTVHVSFSFSRPLPSIRPYPSFVHSTFKPDILPTTDCFLRLAFTVDFFGSLMLIGFSRTLLRYVRFIAWAIRLSSVCRPSAVCL